MNKENIMNTVTTYGIRKILTCSYEEAIPKVKEALSKQGFGVLTEIDVKATLKKKLDVEFNKYIILGACNPNIAHETLKAENEIGLLLPCNVIVYEDENKQTVVSAIDPVKMLEIVRNPELSSNAEKVKELLENAVSSL
jgi:uncharacterized protein (DUF302 family)